MLQIRRRHFQLQAEYIQTLETVWTASLALQGFLLTDGLESPSGINHSSTDSTFPIPDRTTIPLDQMHP
jgi:hypothetical protein